MAAAEEELSGLVDRIVQLAPRALPSSFAGRSRASFRLPRNSRRGQPARRFRRAGGSRADHEEKGWLIYGPGKVRRGTALDDLSASSLQLAESARGPVPLASSSWSGARDVESWGSTEPRETTTEWTGEMVQAGLALVDVT